MSQVSASLERVVRERAAGKCEYCLYPERYAIKRHEIDHFIAKKHRGKDVSDNLCLSCIDCNRHKGTDLAAIDPETDEPTLLFNPLRDIWSEHFRLEGATIKGITSKGRATADLLHFNAPERIAERVTLVELGIYP